MDYQQLFYAKYFLHIGLLILVCVIYTIFAIIKTLTGDLNKNVKMSILEKLILLAVIVIYFFVVALPLIKDKPIIDSKDYIQARGIVYEAEDRGGHRGIMSTIWIEIDGEKMSFYVAKADSSIKVGDNVKVTYIPNSKFAVVEKSSR